MIRCKRWAKWFFDFTRFSLLYHQDSRHLLSFECRTGLSTKKCTYFIKIGTEKDITFKDWQIYGIFILNSILFGQRLANFDNTRIDKKLEMYVWRNTYSQWPPSWYTGWQERPRCDVYGLTNIFCDKKGCFGLQMDPRSPDCCGWKKCRRSSQLNELFKEKM